MYAECFRVVSKLLKDDHHDAVAKRNTSPKRLSTPSDLHPRLEHSLNTP